MYIERYYYVITERTTLKNNNKNFTNVRLTKEITVFSWKTYVYVILDCMNLSVEVQELKKQYVLDSRIYTDIKRKNNDQQSPWYGFGQ